MKAKYKPSDYEVLRRRCVELKEAGWKQKDITSALGLTEGWVSQTLKKYRELGTEGLLARKPPGSLPKLTSEHLSQLVEELKQGAVSHGFPGQIWTRSRVNELIGRLFGVSYDLTQVGRILKKLGWSLQKPVKKARQQSKQKVQQWREETMPELNRIAEAKKPRMRTVLSYISMNQASTYSPSLAVRGHPRVKRPLSRRRQAKNTSV